MIFNRIYRIILICFIRYFFIQFERHGEKLYIFTYMKFLREEFIMNSFLNLIKITWILCINLDIYLNYTKNSLKNFHKS